MTEVDHIIFDDTVPVVLNTNIDNTVNTGGFYGNIARSRGNLYWTANGTDLTDEEYNRILGSELYDTFSKAHEQYNIGNTLQWVGIGCVLAGCVIYGADESEDSWDLFVFSDILGGSSYVVGCILKGIGKGRIEWVKDTYNSGNYSLNKSTNSYPSTVRIAPSLMLTAQRDLGLGASVSFNF